ncbi:MAG: hypothetical protein KGL39_29725 [Patescibacteria group bacterium]|nr:hypothetical protein [Patescibacteria group bacterium]
MHLQYNDIDLQIERMLDLNTENVLDDSGMDVLYQRITLTTQCVINPSATTTFSNQIDPDRAGVAVNKLYDLLMEPRAQLVLSLGNDIVFLCPGNTLRGNGKAADVPCDPAGGPFPQYCRITEVWGAKTVILHYKIVFHINTCNNFVLNNRWRVTSHTGENLLTRRYIDGRATFRLDFLNFQNPLLQADAFRQAFIIPVPTNFRRARVNVIATEDGKELIYHVEDVETYLNLGAKSLITKMHMQSTCGASNSVHGLKDMFKRGMFNIAPSVMKGAANLLAHLLGQPQAGHGFANSGVSEAATFMAGAASGMLPVPKANSTVQVEARPDAKLDDVAKLAVQIATDRFGLKVGTQLLVLGCWVTQVLSAGVDECPTVEVRMEYMPLTKGGLQTMLKPQNAGTMMNWDTVIKGGGGFELAEPLGRGNSAIGAAVGGPSTTNPVFPNSSATRGTWNGFLVTQALQQNAACALPDISFVGPKKVFITDQPLQ